MPKFLIRIFAVLLSASLAADPTLGFALRENPLRSSALQSECSLQAFALLSPWVDPPAIDRRLTGRTLAQVLGNLPWSSHAVPAHSASDIPLSLLRQIQLSLKAKYKNFWAPDHSRIIRYDTHMDDINKINGYIHWQEEDGDADRFANLQVASPGLVIGESGATICNYVFLWDSRTGRGAAIHIMNPSPALADTVIRRAIQEIGIDATKSEALNGLRSIILHTSPEDPDDYDRNESFNTARTLQEVITKIGILPFPNKYWAGSAHDEAGHEIRFLSEKGLLLLVNPQQREILDLFDFKTTAASAAHAAHLELEAA